jgi:hypothetical protein
MFIHVLSIVLSFLSFYSLSLSIPAPANEAAARHRCTWARFVVGATDEKIQEETKAVHNKIKGQGRKRKTETETKKMHESLVLIIFVNRGWYVDGVCW